MTKEDFNSLQVGDTLSNVVKDKYGNLSGWNYQVSHIKNGTIFVDYISVSGMSHFSNMPLTRTSIDDSYWLRKVDKPITNLEQVEEKYCI